MSIEPTLHQTATDLRPVAQRTWEADAKAEFRLLAFNLRDLPVKPCLRAILDDYANRIDELMARAPEAVPSKDPDGQERGHI